MKKIGIMTFHMSFNHGAMLQAYGLSKKLELMGTNPYIIDYRLPFIDRYYHKDFLKDLIRLYGPIGILKYIKRKFNHYYDNPSWHKFYSFMTEKLPLSRQVNLNELKNLNYDCYITGSDQVWNGKLTGGIQGCYFLDFVANSVSKVAYAASSGTNSLDEEFVLEIRQWLSNFNGIGVREDGLRKYIEKEIKLSAKTVLDPTLILGKKEWKKLVHDVPYDNYLLIYAFDEKNYLYEKAREYANRNNLKIIVVAYEKKNLGFDVIQLTDCGPEDFLSYVYYANTIFTSSFHGTAFSIIFEKNFYCFPHPEYHERTDNVLSITALMDRCVYKDTQITESVINYKYVREKLEEKVKESEDFLKNYVL